VADSYGDIHYRVFHVLLPEVVHTGILDGFMVAVRHGGAEEMLALIWRKAACQVLGLPPMSAIPRELELSAASFRVEVDELSAGVTLVVIAAPPVNGPAQAGFAAIALDESQSGVAPRYFTFEAPVLEAFPWMAGEWLAPGRRENLGIVVDPSIESLGEFVRAQLGRAAIPPRRPLAGVSTTNDGDDESRDPYWRRARWPARMAARALRAIARGQRNAGGGWFPLRRTPRR
jgi:hypothetical protein